MSEGQAAKTPIEDLRRNALEHYDKLSTQAHEWLNTIPRAINEFYDREAAREIASSTTSEGLATADQSLRGLVNHLRVHCAIVDIPVAEAALKLADSNQREIEQLRAALTTIANQKMSEAMLEDEKAAADFVGGYDIIVSIARRALATPKEGE